MEGFMYLFLNKLGYVVIWSWTVRYDSGRIYYAHSMSTEELYQQRVFLVAFFTFFFQRRQCCASKPLDT